ncbi:MAG: hypothetical protein ACD_29C00204G0003 [uncultured bacterium]|nr:MAG: hypothetical protein ACD_29C00204G0003 [uncultured bacterium]
MSRDDSNQLKLDESFDVNRALAYAPPFKIDFSKVKTPPTDWLSQLETMCCDYNSTLKKPFAKHTGKDATYTLKKELIDQLQVIYYRLSGDLDVQLGKLSDNQRTSILLKLTEEIQACTAGFHNRVNAIVTSFEGVASLAQLLTQVRQSLVEKTAARLTNEVHATNRVTVIASTAGFGVKPTLLGDIHPGRLTDEEIQKALQETFESEYVPFNLPILLCDQLRGILASVGYHGRHADSYDINDSKTIAMVIEHCLTDSTENTAALEKSKAGYTKYFVIDEDVYDKEKDEYQTYIRDVNWPKIQKLFLAALGREKYFVKEPTMPTLYWYALYHTTEETLVETRRIIEESISKNQYQAFNRITALKSSDPHLYRAISEILVEKINIHQLIAAFYASDIHRDLINIAEVMTIVLEKCNASDLAKELSEKITTGDFAGTNGFYYLMVALNNAALENAADSVKTISALAVTLIEKCDASDLAKGLSEKITAGDAAGTNGFYWLIAALDNAASKNAADSVKTISALAVTLIEKCNTSDLAKELSEKITTGNFAGTNGFYWLIAALDNAASKNAADSVKTISALAVTLIKKCNASDLAKGLSEKRIVGDDAGTHGFYWLMEAVINVIKIKDVESTQIACSLLFRLLGKLKKESLPVDVQAIFLKHKTVLQDSLKAYLSQIDSVLQLKAVSCTDTMLGVLIDHQVHFIKKPQSNTRLLVDSCIFKKSPIDRIKYISIQLSKKKEKYYLELNSFFPRNKKLVNTKLKTLEGILKLTNDIIDMKKGVIDYSVFQNDMKKIIDDAQENKFLIQDDKKINELFTALDQAICSLSSAASPTSHAPSPTPMDDANVSPRRQ